MPMAKWTPAMINILLDHVDTEKGEQGLYVTDKRAAIETVAKHLTKSFTSNPVNAKQVDHKLHALFSRSRNLDHTQIKALFNLGRTALRPPYNQRLSESDRLDNDEWILPETYISSDESSGGGSSRRTSYKTRKRPSLETPISSLKKKSKRDVTLGDQSMPSPSRAKSLILRVPVDKLSSSRLCSPVHDDLRPLLATNKLKVEDELSHSQLNLSMAAPFGTGTLFKDEESRQAQTAVREYLVQDAEAFIPCVRDLSEQRSQIMDQIHSLALTLGELSKPTFAHPPRYPAATRYYGTPRFYEALSDRDFSDLCMHIYGITTKNELREKMTRSQVSGKVFLEAFLAVAVTEWVFCEGHISVPQLLTEKTAFSETFESQFKKRRYFLHRQRHGMLRSLFDLVFPKQYEQLLRESRCIHARNEKNFEPYIGDLSHRLHETLRPFLECNNIVPVNKGYKSWLAGLYALFLGALKFKAQVTLRSGRHDFRFPSVDKMFDPQTMNTESGDIEEGEKTVEIGLFPAVIQISEPLTVMDKPTEETLFNAIVVLQ